MRYRVVKWSNSLGVLVPKAVVEKARLREGDSIVNEVVDGEVHLRRALTLEELISGITPENRHGETDWGPDVGKEIVEW